MQITVKIRPWAAVTAMLLFGLCLSAAAQDKKPTDKYAPLLGTWDAQTESSSRTFVFEFFLKDGVLKGKYTGAAGSTEMEGLTFENSTVRFKVTVSAMELEFWAVIDGDKLTGEVSLQYGQADITGKKR